MSEQKRKDQVIAVRSLIKRLLVHEREKRQEKENSAREEESWNMRNAINHEESFAEELEAAIHMAECVYDLDGPEDLPDNPELVEFLFAEPDKPASDVQDPLETIDLGTKEDPRPIQISGLLKTKDRAEIVTLLHEFKDYFAWHYIEMPSLDPTLVEHMMPIKEGFKPVKQAPRRMSNEIEDGPWTSSGRFTSF